MANAKRVTFFKTTLEDKPGALLAVAKDLKSKNIGLLGLWGVGNQQGQGDLYCIPKNPDNFRKAYKTSGMQMDEGSGFFVKGADRTGALVKTLETIAKEGINMTAIHAIASGANYGAFIRVAQADLEKTAKALGAK